MGEELEEKGRRDLVRKIRNTNIKIRNIDFENIALNDLKMVLLLAVRREGQQTGRKEGRGNIIVMIRSEKVEVAGSYLRPLHTL
jgi:hypothetical protein